MTPDELGAHLAERIAGAQPHVEFDGLTVTVPVDRWVEAATLARDEPGVDLTFFDWLSASEEVPRSPIPGADGDADGWSVVLHTWSPVHRHHLLLRTVLPRDRPHVATLVDVYAGADWHERETAEMFGIVFDGHPNLVPLLLPDGFEGHPLRKEFVLAARASKAWPGAKEPGETEEAPAETGRRAPRRTNQPPGVPPEESAWPRPVPTETTNPTGAR